VRFRLTDPARRDIARALSDSHRLFGALQSKRYLEIIRAGIAIISENPDHPTSKSRPEIKPGIRSFHLQLAAKRLGAASHVVYYVVLSPPGVGDVELIVLRVLNDRMDPHRRVRSVLKGETGR